ncbi:MAG: sugar phosphate isomerase/epimerase [bacterium]|nr:sugar phosphate isomerase/epimerase [bacterium]
MVLGYNTNGFAFHRLEDAVAVLASIGYRSVAVTLDHHHLDPFADDFEARAGRIKGLLAQHGLTCVIETGARFLLDPLHKHQPTLVSHAPDGRHRRIAFLNRAIRAATLVDAQCVSLWSGAADDDAEPATLWTRLETGLGEVLAEAERHDVRLAFEPEPGMFVETMAQFEKLYDLLDHPLFGLNLDVGHLHCLNDGHLLDHLRKWGHVLFNVHLEDMCRGHHEHLFFGEGEINFCETIDYLTAVAYRGPIHVELSNHSRSAVETARRAYAFLSGLGL